jgi:hypothetical protein
MRSAFKPANMGPPSVFGPRMIDMTFDFTQPGVGVVGNNYQIQGDLTQERETNLIDVFQSVFIDNSANPSTFSFLIKGVGKNGQTIEAKPFTQGYYAVSVEDHLMFSATTDFYGVIPVLLYNQPFPYSSWEVGAPLVRSALSFAPLVVGDNTFMAAVANQRNRLYRSLFDVSGNANVQFFDGPSVNGLALTGLMTMYAGGSIYYPYDGIAHFRTSRGNALILNASAAVNMGGNLLGVSL